jgi:hypothetical protein
MVRVVRVSAKADGKGGKASSMSVKEALLSLLLFLSGLRSQKPTEAKKTVIEVEANKKKRKASGSTLTAPPRPTTCKATTSRPVARKMAAVDIFRPVDRKVIDEMPQAR